MANTIEDSVARGDSPDATQRLIDERAALDRQALLAKAQRLYELREQFDLWSDLLNFTDDFTVDSGLVRFGTGAANTMSMAYSYALNRPSATACAYINLVQLNIIRAHSRAFCLLNPYWWAIQHNRASYVIESGHTYSIAPKNPKQKAEDGLLSDVQEVIDELCLANDWPNYQREKLRRRDRDGEFILRFVPEENDEGYRILSVPFQEPRLLWDPPDKSAAQNVWFGIQFNGTNYQRPQGYYLRPADYLGNTDARGNAIWSTMIGKEEIQHRKYNVDMNSPRGIPTTYAIHARLDQALRTVVAMGKLVHYREKIALIRKHINATLSTVQAYLGNRYSVNPYGQMKTIDDMPDAAVLDTNDQTQYEFPSQHVDADKIVHAVLAELRAAAAATGMADFMVSADASGGSFASQMVSEGPVDKTFKRLQAEIIADDQVVFKEQIKLAFEDGRLPGDVLKKIKVVATPPGIISRNRIQETQADDLLVKDFAMSRRTMAMRTGLDPDAEFEQVKSEQAAIQAMMPEEPAGDGGNRTPAGRQKVTNRPFRPDDEPGPKANPQ